MIRLFYSLLLIICISLQSFAQAQREYSGLFDTYYYRGPFSITGGAGIAAYNGDLGTFNKPSYAFTLGANYKVWPRIALGAELLIYQLKGAKTSDSVSSSFSSSNMELDLYGRFYIIDDIVRVAADRNKQPKLIKPYITAGLGFLRYSPTLSSEYKGSMGQSVSNTTSASGFTMAIPAGAGLSLGISPRVSLLAEATYRYTFSSDLDAISQKKDGYLLACIKVQYSPFVPKGKKKKSKGGSPPAQYDGPKGTETWKNRKPAPKNEDNYPPLPGEEQPQENPDNQEQQPTEGEENQQNQDQETPAPQSPAEKSSQ